MSSQSTLTGRLEDIHFPDVLLQVSQRRDTGILYLHRQKIEKEIYFQDGRIVFAKSNDPDQRLGELLLRRGKISLRQLVDSASKIVPGVRLGTILVQEGYLKAADLYQGVIDQVEEIVYSVFDWSDGTYEFQTGALPSREVITLSISTPDIINAGIARIWRWAWISKGVGPLDTIYMRRKEWNSIAKRMLITPAVQAIIDLLEQPMNLEDVLKTSRINSYETCKLLWALLSTGIIEKIPRLELPAELQEAAGEPTVEAPAVETPAAEVPAETGVAESAPTEVISWQPRRLPSLEPLSAADTAAVAAPQGDLPEPPAPTPPPPVQDVPPPVLPEEPAAAPTVEISFSDLAEFTDAGAAAEPQPRPEETSAEVIGKDVSRFNELHRYLFEMLRMEMGAGVGNFLSKILKKAAEKHPLVFEGVRMNEFGELDSGALRASIQGNLVEDYGTALHWLLQEERATAGAFLDRKRLDIIESGLHKLQERQRESN